MVARCPECNAVITYLCFSEDRVEHGTYSIRGGSEDAYTDYGECRYKCPECDSTLCFDSDEADEILENNSYEDDSNVIKTEQYISCETIKEKSIQDLGKGM